jgi:adenylate cyclase
VGAAKEEKKSIIPSWARKALHLSPLKISILVMAACVFSVVRHYRAPHSQASVDLIGTLERSLLDIRFKMRGPRPVSGEVGILAADEQSVAKFGRWPFPRTVYAQAITNLLRCHLLRTGAPLPR